MCRKNRRTRKSQNRGSTLSTVGPRCVGTDNCGHTAQYIWSQPLSGDTILLCERHALGVAELLPASVTVADSYSDQR